MIEPPMVFAHPLDTGGAGRVYKSLAQTALELKQDGPAYATLFESLGSDVARHDGFETVLRD